MLRARSSCNAGTFHSRGNRPWSYNMEAMPSVSKKKLPITRILLFAFGALAVAGSIGGYYYLDYHSGSQSSTFHPNGMELSLITRGFNSGTTGVGTVQGENMPLTFLARVKDFEFKVTETDVVLCEKQVAKIPVGTKKVSIVSYKASTTINADGKRIATIQSGNLPLADAKRTSSRL